jgi:hypothetical protein
VQEEKRAYVGRQGESQGRRVVRQGRPKATAAEKVTPQCLQSTSADDLRVQAEKATTTDPAKKREAEELSKDRKKAAESGMRHEVSDHGIERKGHARRRRRRSRLELLVITPRHAGREEQNN